MLLPKEQKHMQVCVCEYYLQLRVLLFWDYVLELHDVS